MLEFEFQNKIDNLLKHRFNQTTGAIDYSESPELKNELNYCYDILDTNSKRKNLVDYVQNFIPHLKSEISIKEQLINSYGDKTKNSFEDAQFLIIEIMKQNLIMTNEWINEKREVLNNELKEKEITLRKDIEKVKWKGKPTELVELIRALLESNVLDNTLTHKEIVSRFESFFDFKLKGYVQTQTKIRGRTKDLTIFTKKLDRNLENWIKNKD